MKAFTIRAVSRLFLLFSAAHLLIGHASSQTGSSTDPEVLSCSPAPCVLPPTQASEGGYFVNTSPIVANPADPKHLLLGGNDANCQQFTGFVASHTSTDGGSTWSGPFCMEWLGAYNAGGAGPIVGYDRKGTAYMGGLYFNGYSNGFVGVEKSSDGINWSKPVAALKPAGGFADFPWLAVDTNLDSPHANSLYVSAVAITDQGAKNQVVVAHSTDGGASWSSAAVAPVQTYPANDLFTDLTVGKDGTVYLTWMYCNAGPNECDNHKGYMLFSKSRDGGNSWSTPTLMTTVTLLSTSLPNTNVGVTNYPVIGVDNSTGPNAGNLYVVMYSWTGTYLRVGVIRSTDGGKTWSKPVPVAPPSDTHDQFFPWLSVSSTGLVGVSWLDRRNDPANVDYQAFAAISADGGQTFKPNVQLTKAFSNPNVNGYPSGWMGDYTGNTWAGPDFVAAWMDSSNDIDMQEVVGGIRLHR